MDQRKVYCDECKFLENRQIKAEVPLDSGNYIVTGNRFYCPKHDKWWPIRATLEDVSFSYCVYGERKDD